MNEIFSSSEEYFQGRQEVYALQNKIQNFYAHENLLEEIKAKSSVIDGAFLKNNDFVFFIIELEELAGKNNIDINIRSVVSPTNENPYYVLETTMTGAFPDFLRNLFALEGNSFSEYRLVEIQKISLKRIIKSSKEEVSPEGSQEAAEAVQESLVEAELEIKVYSNP